MTPLYTTTAVATGDGRGGAVRLADGSLGLDLAVPTELGGPGGGPNPEQLFAMGYAACFHSALKLVAGKAGVATTDSAVVGHVGIGRAGAGFGLSVQLEVELPDVDEATARQLLDAAHAVCPYSAATRGNIPVTVTLA
ncbi:organic hydroperoxide resistance protein [Thalassiella azotivora]